MHTNQDARDFITQAIEASGADVAVPSEYDIDAIARDVYAESGTWDMEAADDEVFWAAVERHQVTA